MTCVKHPWGLIISKRSAAIPPGRRRASVQLRDWLLQIITSAALCGPAWAQAGMHNIVAEVARTPEQQQTGMMMRTEMATHEGMLFVFDDVAPRCFWMKNTLLPLAIAFIEDDGTVVNIAEMKPRSEASHCSEKPVRFALEMNQGWFSKRAIKPGFRLKGPPFKP